MVRDMVAWLADGTDDIDRAGGIDRAQSIEIAESTGGLYGQGR
jgi:hypothetical protein